MKTKKTLLAAVLIAAIAAAVLYLNPFKKNISAENERLLKTRILEIDKSVETVKLSELTPFKWDEVYSFAPYMSREDIHKAIGYRWSGVKETVNEGMNQILFMNKGKVVCYVYGYPSHNGYGITFNEESYKNGTAAFKYEDDISFSVSSEDNYISLIYEK